MPEAWRSTWPLPRETDANGNPMLDHGAEIFFEELWNNEYRENNPEWETNPTEDGLADDSYKSALSVALSRRDVLQSIGNLTLVTGALNSRLSNRPFSEKKARLFQNSLLVLNREICEYDSWDYPQVHQRGRTLIESFRSIWPSAKSFTERLGEAV